MSQSEMALLPYVLPTASQALTTDSVFISVELKIFNLFVDAGFQSAAVVFLLTAWCIAAKLHLADCWWYTFAVVLLQWIYNDSQL